MKKKNRLIIIITSLLFFYILIGIFFFSQFSQFSQNKINNEIKEITFINETLNQILQKEISSSTTQEELNKLVEEHPMELFIRDVKSENVLYSTMDSIEIWNIRELFHDDVILYKSQGEIKSDKNEYYVSYVIYNLSDGVLIELNFQSLLIYVTSLIILIVLVLTSIIFLLLFPLENLKKAIAKMNIMKLEDLIDDENVIASDLNKFAHNLNETTMKVARQYTDLEVALQFERERLLVMMDISRAFVHDLKTPIHQTLLENELMVKQKKVKTNDALILANYNVERSDFVLKQVNEILSLMDTKVMDIEDKIERFDFVAIFDATWNLFQFFITQNDLTIYPETPAELWVTMNKVSSKLILHNMLSNATKYAVKNSEIEVVIEEPEGDFFTVWCTNIADEKNIERMKRSKELFSVVDNDQDYSSGNGLYLLRELTTFLGGKFELLIEDNRATIKITLPLNQEKVVKIDD